MTKKKNPKAKKILMPDDCLGLHEVLDHAWIAMVENLLLEHPRLTPAEQKLANKAFSALYDLYQLAGKKNFEEDIKVFLKPTKATFKGTGVCGAQYDSFERKK